MCRGYSTSSQNCCFLYFRTWYRSKKKRTCHNSLFSWLCLINENIHICSVFLIYLLWKTQKLSNKSLLSSERKKSTFACAIFGKICYVACAINRAGKSVCLRACLPARARSRRSHWQACFTYPLETLESQWFPDVFKGYRKRPLAWNVYSRAIAGGSQYVSSRQTTSL